ELPEALEAASARHRNMGLPVGRAHPVALRPDADSAVDDGNQVRVGGDVQGLTRPRPVDAGEEDVAVERGAEALLLDDACFADTDVRISGCRVFEQRGLGDLDLTSKRRRV